MKREELLRPSNRRLAQRISPRMRAGEAIEAVANRINCNFGIGGQK
jgi:hypothetical protein